MSLCELKGDENSSVSKFQHHKCGQRQDGSVNCLLKYNVIYLRMSCCDLRFLLAISDHSY